MPQVDEIDLPENNAWEFLAWVRASRWNHNSFSASDLSIREYVVATSAVYFRYFDFFSPQHNVEGLLFSWPWPCLSSLSDFVFGTPWENGYYIWKQKDPLDNTKKRLLKEMFYTIREETKKEYQFGDWCFNRLFLSTKQKGKFHIHIYIYIYIYMITKFQI